MQKLLATSFLALSLLLLAACGKPSDDSAVTYLLTFTGTGTTKRDDLIEASKRVVQSRLEALDGKAISQVVEPAGSGARLTVYVSDPALAAPLTEGLLTPLTFRVMRQAEPAETPDITVEKFGGFIEAGLTEKHIQWTTANDRKDDTSQGNVTIELTPAGRLVLRKIFADHPEKVLGIFVRGRLVSRLTDPGEHQASIAISGIPTREVAAVFADDVNVGIHVTFQPETD